MCRFLCGINTYSILFKIYYISFVSISKLIYMQENQQVELRIYFDVKKKKKELRTYFKLKFSLNQSLIDMY